jgi:hypothetical protein
MNNILRIVAIAVLAIGLVACDDIIIPDDPRGGGQGDSTGTGGDDTTGGGDRDTNVVSMITLSGPIVNGLDSSAVQLPDGADVIVAWDRGNGELYVYGQGSIESNRVTETYSVSVSTNGWNDEALFDPDGTAGIHGVGMIMLVDKEMPDHTIFWPSNSLPFLGQVFEANIIYNTGKEKATPWTIGWLDDFSVGFSIGVPAFNGYIPSQNGMYPLVYMGR